jgi:hypothetical protein
MALGYRHPELLAHEVSLSVFWQDQSVKRRETFTASGGNDFLNREKQPYRLSLSHA